MTLQEELLADLSVEFQDSETFSADLMNQKIKNAIRDVRMARCYQNTSYSEQKIESDLQTNYYSVCRNIALYDYLQTGASFEEQHSENGVNRTWVNRNTILGNVPAFVKVL